MSLEGTFRDVGKRAVAVAVALLGLAGTAGAADPITVAGDLLIDVDVTAAGVSPGTLAAPLTNNGTLEGAFTPYNNPQIIPFQTAKGTKNVLAQSGAINLVLQSGGVDVPAPAEMTGNSDWTVEGWLQVETFAGDCQWLGWAPTNFVAQHAAALLYATAGGYPAAWFSLAGGGYWLTDWGPLNPNPVATDKEWHYVVYTWDGINTFRTYMDGVPSNTGQVQPAGLDIQAGQKIMLGRCYGDDGNPAYSPPNTRIAKVRVHSEALDDAGVLANYNAEKSDFDPAPAPRIEVMKPLASLVVFGAQDSAAGPTAKAAFEFQNTGYATLPAGFTVALGGANPGDFVLDPPDTEEIAVGASRSFSVAFDPVADNAPKLASLTLSWPAGPAWSAGSVSIRLYGNNAIVYVDQVNGNDTSGLGTETTPWQTIARALSSTLQGDTIMLEPGTYPCDDGGTWNQRVRQLESTEGAESTTIEAGDHWFNSFGPEPTVLAIKGIRFTPRAIGSGTCWLHNGGDSVFSLTLTDCLFQGDWGWDYTVGTASVRRSEVIAKDTEWTTPDTAIQDINDVANKIVKIDGCAFDGCRRAVDFSGRKSSLEIVDSAISSGIDAGISGNVTDSTVVIRGVDIDGVSNGPGISFGVIEATTVTVTKSSAINCAMAGAFFAPNINGTTNVPSVVITECVFIDNCRNTGDMIAAQAGLMCNGWDNANDVPAGSVLIDRCWIGQTAHQTLAPLKQAVSLIDLGSAIVRNSVIEGGSQGIAMVTIDNRTKRIENCTLMGTEEASTDEVTPDSTVAISHKDPTNYGEGTNAPVVLNCLAYGFDALNAGTPWAAGSSNNLASIEGDPALVDPKLAFQAGAAFERPAAVSPLASPADYRAVTGSPAINAGTCVGAPDHDYDGKPRPIGGSCDIGAFEAGEAARGNFKRGDTNNDGKADISDGIFLLNHLFSGGPRWVCEEGADINSDTNKDLSDAVYLFNFLFLGGPELAAPYPECGPDPGGEVCPESVCN